MSSVPKPAPTTSPPMQRPPGYERLIDLLQKREAMSRLAIIGIILGGAACTFVAMALLTVVVFAIIIRYTFSGPDIGFLDMLGRVSLCVLPFLFLYAAWRQGSFLEEGIERIDDSTVAGVWAGPYLGCALSLLDVANIGPQLIVQGIRRWWRRRSIGPVDLDIAARAVATLAIANEGLEPNQLFPADQRSEKFSAALAFLFFHRIADYSSDGKKVWICSDAKKELEVETAEDAIGHG